MTKPTIIIRKGALSVKAIEELKEHFSVIVYNGDPREVAIIPVLK